MAKRDLKMRYAGSFLGILWAVIQPLVMILVFWFVFSVGFKVRPNNDVPFVVWFAAGLSAWSVFSEIVNGSAGLVVSSANLVKKTLFASEILSIIKTITAFVLHLVFLVILLGLLFFQDMPLSFFYFQVGYYALCMIVFSLGLSWIISSLNVFVRDTNHIVGVIMQIGFWATPIFWDPNMMSQKVQMLLKLNPMFYIVQGYRDSFIYFVPFWNHPYQTIYFWFFAGVSFIVGVNVFLKLKPQFADLL